MSLTKQYKGGVITSMATTISIKNTILVSVCFFLFSSNTVFSDSRNYDPQMLELGKTTFQANCAVCHGLNAEGTVKEWHKPDAQGKYPPPPLNGTAHTWHHPIGALFHTIKNGTVSIGGSMPAWEEKLSDDEIFSTIIWLTSLWPDEIYRAWMQRNNKN